MFTLVIGILKETKDALFPANVYGNLIGGTGFSLADLTYDIGGALFAQITEVLFPPEILLPTDHTGTAQKAEEDYNRTL